jgi:protein-disulfide isomerase
MRKFFVIAVITVLSLLFAQPGFSQKSKELDAVKEDIKALKEGQQVIQKDIQDIKNQLKAKPAPAEFKETVVNVEGDPFKGSKDAKLALIEFSDYQWPFCSRHVRETSTQIVKDYVDTGKIRYYFLDFPLGFHKQAFKAAEAGACAGEQGKFWEMHDMLFENQKAINPEDLVKYAESLGLDMPKFKECLDSGKTADEIKKDMAEGQKAGVSGTPSSLIGWVQEDGKSVKAVKIVKGAQPYAAFKDAIESLLAPKK